MVGTRGSFASLSPSGSSRGLFSSLPQQRCSLIQTSEKIEDYTSLHSALPRWGDKPVNSNSELITFFLLVYKSMLIISLQSQLVSQLLSRKSRQGWWRES